MFPSPNNTIVRAVKAISGRLYSGCYMDFGYWEKNALGRFKYTSLVKELNIAMLDDEHIWHIVPFEEWILFQSLNRIYFYNKNTQKVTFVESGNTIGSIYKIKNNIYYDVTNEGLYKIENGNSNLILKSGSIHNKKIINVFPHNKALLILTGNSGFYLLKNGRVSKWNTSSDKELEKISIYSSIRLKDNRFVLGTISNGILILNKNGRIIYRINKFNGLNNNTALSLFEDSDKNIWAGLDNGISCINIASPIRIYKDNKGILGTVYASKIFNGNLYVGTNQGLFFKNFNNDDDFQFIKGTAGQVWTLFTYNNELLCGHNAGTFLVKGNKASLIINTPGTWTFKTIPGMKDCLMQGNYMGLNIICKENGRWKLRNKLQGFDNSARYVEIFDGKIWVNHEYKGVFKLTADKDYTRILEVVKEPEVSLGKHSSITKFNGQLLYSYQKGVFRFDTIKNRFIRDSLLSRLVLNGEYLSGKLIADETGKLWAFTKNKINILETNSFNNEYRLKEINIPSYLIKGMVGFENITHIDEDKFLIGTSNGYITLDLPQLKEHKKRKIYLNSVFVQSLGEPAGRLELNAHPELSYTQNSFIFQFSVPDYALFHSVEYQYKLDGLYNVWSDWSDKGEAVFKNLSFGDYNFKARAKVAGLPTENIIEYNFTIKRPWYLSDIAIAVYVLILLSLLFLTHKIHKNYYNRKHKRKQIEQERRIMKIENEKLNQDIENKNRELAISTMSIVKRNEILYSIKKELLKKDNTGKNISAIIKLIDSNLNNSKDWEFFEEAFNNADRHFLEKIKNLHPDLTHNDLRFCAYLRLNLTSKEIAPLLNISVRSVEIKRYRLRKKMNLKHDESLVEYILHI
jgi:ligand-binding sensor domain-containing protein/DNA-binding CsgD family transcriptional regulator